MPICPRIEGGFLLWPSSIVILERARSWRQSGESASAEQRFHRYYRNCMAPLSLISPCRLLRYSKSCTLFLKAPRSSSRNRWGNSGRSGSHCRFLPRERVPRGSQLPIALGAQHALARAITGSGALGTLHDIEVQVSTHTPWELWTFLKTAPRLEIVYHSIHYIDLVRSWLGNPSVCMRAQYATSARRTSPLPAA